MRIHGKNLIGTELAAARQEIFQGYNPREGGPSGDQFHEADTSEIERAGELAREAAGTLQELRPDGVARFLEAIRKEILETGDALIAKADEETALGLDRLRGERDRTVNQLKLFADLVREGSWVDARIDTELPDRKPLPRPDIRRMLAPLGPVAVFGASNFPLAFSVAGGDTASAFAARNPVIVKAHPAHPATSELVGMAIVRAVQRTGLPPGTFSMLHGLRPEVSIALVMHPAVKTVAFTGSERAGRALFDAAAKRAEPVPVFAEMGSVNPVFLLADALAERAEATADALYRSVTLGVGQFCTCPGLAIGVAGSALERFADRLAKQTEEGTPATMLNPHIARGFNEAWQRAAEIAGVETKMAARAGDPKRAEGRPGLLMTDARTWLKHRELREEIFGPSTIVVRCASDSEAIDCAKALEGSLTATVHGTLEDLARNRELIAILQRKAGRLIFNGYPTGVEVSYAMQHGGPYPASTDARFTSVGAAAIYRFARPVCFQGFPDAALPEELQNANPRGIWRMIDGQWTKNALQAAAAVSR